MAKSCVNYATIPFGECQIQNNAYGYQGTGNPPQCISGPPIDPIGWTWNWPGSNNSTVVAYPEIIFGKKPFNPSSTTTKLPKVVNSIQQLSVAYDLTVTGSSSLNAAFDLWLTNSSQADQSSITTEIMLWVKQDTLNPAGSFVQTFDTPYGKADLYQTQLAAWSYCAFVLQQETLSATVDLLLFINLLSQQGLLSTSDYLASVEFGNEIAYGQGATTINNYAVTIG